MERQVEFFIQDMRGHLAPLAGRPDGVARQQGLQHPGGPQDLAQGHALAQLVQGGAVLQLEDVLGAEQLRGAAGGCD